MSFGVIISDTCRDNQVLVCGSGQAHTPNLGHCAAARVKTVLRDRST